MHRAGRPILWRFGRCISWTFPGKKASPDRSFDLHPEANRSRRFWLTLTIALICVAAQAQWTDPTVDVPAFHPTAPARSTTLPPILHGKDLSGINFQLAWQVKVYRDAAKISGVLYQLPCYCRCDRAAGHTSLRSCFEGLHGAECSTCAKEGFYAYRMTRKGWTPSQIRAGIERGDWKKIDLDAGKESHPRS